MQSLFFRIPLDQIAYVRAIVDGYDGLVLIRSDANRGEIEWVVARGCEAEATALAAHLGKSTGMMPIARPADWPFAVE